MQVYNNGIEAGKHKRYILHQDGSYFLRLHGVNIIYNHRTIDLLPVYKALFYMQRTPGALRIEFKPKSRIWRIIFLRRKPFILTEVIETEGDRLE